MRKVLFALMIGLLVVFSSCDEDEIVNSQIDFLFKETYCANPWDSIVTPEWTREQIISYYLTDLLEVEFSDLQITDDGVAQTCLACNCLTGDNIRFSTSEEFSEILIESGFEVEE